MTPHARILTARTPPRSRPRVLSAKRKNLLDLRGNKEYQNTVWGPLLDPGFRGAVFCPAKTSHRPL